MAVKQVNSVEASLSLSSLLLLFFCSCSLALYQPLQLAAQSVRVLALQLSNCKVRLISPSDPSSILSRSFLLLSIVFPFAKLFSPFCPPVSGAALAALCSHCNMLCKQRSLKSTVQLSLFRHPTLQLFLFSLASAGRSFSSSFSFLLFEHFCFCFQNCL